MLFLNSFFPFDIPRGNSFPGGFFIPRSLLYSLSYRIMGREVSYGMAGKSYFG
jgi:hypothetical protein